MKAALQESGFPQTPGGAQDYLRQWAKTMEPEYLMASTPHDYRYGQLANWKAGNKATLMPPCCLSKLLCRSLKSSISRLP